VIRNIQPPDEAGIEDLTFLFNAHQTTKAGAVVAAVKVKGKHGIVVKDVKRALYSLLQHLDKQRSEWGISPKAEVASDVRCPRRCRIEPFVVVEQGAGIGQGTVIKAHSYVGEGVVIGRDVTIHPHVIIFPGTVIRDHVVIHGNTVIGKPGFGYVKGKRFRRIPHSGGVIVNAFVEIGGNVAVDRATIGSTIIGEGTKIDNLVHIGHNVRIGKNCIIMGQVGIAGSARIGDNVTLCGQVGVSDHVRIGNNAVVYAKSAVFKSIPARRVYSGIPAREHKAVLRALGRLYREP
jgi:UDP-3-O-[3-hydroxymyristoyl] glucosamine N-acyltransferase